VETPSLPDPALPLRAPALPPAPPPPPQPEQKQP
jgi:hypothetical protein